MTDDGAAAAAEAYAERGAGRTGRALELYLLAADRSSDPRARAHRLRHAGDIHQDEGRDDLAAPLYEEALALYRGRPDTSALDLANLLRPLAMLREKAGAREEAAVHWAEAAALYEAAGVDIGAKECARRLSALSSGP